MEPLHVDGQSIKFVDRKMWKRDSFDVKFEGKIDFTGKVFEIASASNTEGEVKRSHSARRKCPIEIEYPRKRRILKRPKRFKNYFSDRKPLAIPSFSFPRLGEPFPFRGRQTLCKYYDGNEVLSEQLREIKSAETVLEFKRLFSEQLRNPCSSAKSIQPYYDAREVLSPLKPFASETCLCTRDLYRLTRLVSESKRSPSPTNALNALRTSLNKPSIDAFVSLASDCYDRCINVYLDNLSECNRRAEIVERQSATSPSGYSGRRSLKSRKINEQLLVNQISKLSINLETHHQQPTATSFTDDHFFSTRQSTLSLPQCSSQTMSSNDANNNSTECTNNLKDPPKIVLSDHSTNNQSIQGDNSKDTFSDRRNSADDKNSLTIPIENYYSSEARPP